MCDEDGLSVFKYTPLSFINSIVSTGFTQLKNYINLYYNLIFIINCTK